MPLLSRQPAIYRHRPWALRGAMALALGLPGSLLAADPPGLGGIYTCVDDQGRRLTSDRPIAACSAKEQRVLNSDGSLKTIHPPTLTSEERAEQEARVRRAADARAAQFDAVRRDRNLLQRFPDEEAHQKSRESAVDTVKAAMKTSEQRLKELASERKPLKDEAEFYVGKPLPNRLRAQIDANEAAVTAQRSSMLTQEAELDRINKLYDAERDRLRRLWAGAQPGSLGPLADAEPAKRSTPR